MRQLFSTKVRIILVLAVLLAAGLAVVAGVTNQSLPNMIVQGVLAPFRAAGTAMMDTAEKYYGYMFRYEALRQKTMPCRRRSPKWRTLPVRQTPLPVRTPVCATC